MSESIFSDEFKTEPYWWEAARPSAKHAEQLPDETDVAIVGSGYSGLSTALELARSGTSVTVMDREEIGHGASSRNGGLLSTEPKFASKTVLRERLGAAHAERIIEDGRATFTNLKEIIEREGIDCHLERNGRFVGAHCPKAFDNLTQKVRQYEAEGLEGFELIPRSRQHEIVGDSNYYHGGLLERDGGSLHPGLYHQGLVKACLKAGVTLVGGTDVTAIGARPGSFAVETSRGTIGAREVVIGTNGYTSSLTPWQRERVIPIGSYIIATEEIGAERVESMFRQFCTMSNTQRVLFYYRPSPDHQRILFGGRASFGTTDALTAAPTLRKYLTWVYPQLRNVKITHSWTGNVAFTFDYLPHMGTHEGVHYLMGCNGSGVAMMSYLGRQTALKILGKTNRPCAFEEIPFDTRPGYNGNPWFLPLIGNWYRLRDHIDRFFA